VIFWWPEYMWTSELHGAVAHASQNQIIGKLECAAGQGGGGHRYQIKDYELRIRKTKMANIENLTSRTTPQSATAATVKPQATRLPLQPLRLTQPPIQLPAHAS